MKNFRVDIIADHDSVLETTADDKREKKRSREELHVAVFERLGRLHRLDTLDLLRQPFMGVADLERRMNLDLQHGPLEDLGPLEVLSFGNQQVLEEEELSWMKIHWKKLRQISGPSHPDSEQMRKIDLAMNFAHVNA
ncbi:hypothetical protein BGZ97_009233 [Linnemannia gamsii]|uniref:Uncharacterized protein n=1 Tax=Linnemannia gamsii TaxID=64522 RepID=A0A9P6UEC2_9FUNG|nr:hypothetical protein BGZ97_009233 [Linnemannia gamsii]